MGGYAPCVHLGQLIALTVVYSSTTLLDGFVLGVVLALVGYFLSERYKRSRGVTPWRVPSGMWAVLLFLLSLIGVVMYLIACFTTRPRTGPTDFAGGDQHWSPGRARLDGRAWAGLERTCAGPMGPRRSPRMGRACARTMAIAAAWLRSRASARGLGGGAPARDGVPRTAWGAGRRRLGTTRTAATTAEVMAPRSRWAP